MFIISISLNALQSPRHVHRLWIIHVGWNKYIKYIAFLMLSRILTTPVDGGSPTPSWSSRTSESVSPAKSFDSSSALRILVRFSVLAHWLRSIALFAADSGGFLFCYSSSYSTFHINSFKVPEFAFEPYELRRSFLVWPGSPLFSSSWWFLLIPFDGGR